MANRKATFAKRQRETDLKDRAKQKEDRRSQKRGEVRDSKGPQIAWDEAVHAVTSSDDLPPLAAANQQDDADAEDAAEGPTRPVASTAPVTPTHTAGPARPSPTPAAAAVPAPATARPSSAPAKSGPVATKPTTSPNPASPRRVG
jgi:hypothetical protein